MNKRILKKRAKQARNKIFRFVGDVPPGFAIVIIRLRGSRLMEHGSWCSLTQSNGNGKVINTRCIGARNRDGVKKVFVVWRNGNDFLQLAEYLGEDLFPEYENI